MKAVQIPFSSDRCALSVYIDPVEEVNEGPEDDSGTKEHHVVVELDC